MSDHTLGIGVSTAAVAQGATLIEKHFTLSRKEGGIDSSFSLEPDEMRSLIIETERAWLSLGEISYGPSEEEKGSTALRRSLYISENMKKGDSLNENNLRIIRPGLGLAPKYFNTVLGRIVKKNLKKGTPLSWELIK